MTTPIDSLIYQNIILPAWRIMDSDNRHSVLVKKVLLVVPQDELSDIYLQVVGRIRNTILIQNIHDLWTLQI